MVIETLGGYRLVRKLGSGARADVFLAHPLRVASDTVPAAIKIFRPDVAEHSIMVEIDALSRSAGAHVVELLDLTTAPDGRPALILGRFANGCVGKVIGARATLSPGEVITMLVPVTAVIGRLHHAGVVHGAVRADAVLLDAVGCPTLACFGSARLFSSDLTVAGRDAEPAFAGDREALKLLAVTVLGRVPREARRGVLEWLTHSSTTEVGWLDEMETQLFSLGEPMAIDLRPDVTDSVSLLPSRVLRAEPVADDPSSMVFAGLAIPEALARFIPGRLRNADWSARARSFLATVRPRFWVAIGASCVAVLAAVAIVPQGARNTLPAPLEAEVAASNDTAMDTSASPAAISMDDPLAATVQLLRAREGCLRSMSVLCLDAVVQPESSAAVADQTLVRAIQDGQEPPPAWHVPVGSIELEERLGDSAIVRLGEAAENQPASLLLIKSEAGWRIRGYLNP